MQRESASPSSAAVEQFVLCIDDDAAFLKSLEGLLPEAINEAGADAVYYRCVFLSSPQEALAVLRELHAEHEAVAMILSDEKMPGMRGTDLLLESRAIYPDAVRVLLTGQAGMESAITAINERLLDKYLTKPIEQAHAFAVTVRHLLRSHALQDTLHSREAALRRLFDLATSFASLASKSTTMTHIVGAGAAILPGSRADLLLPENDGTALLPCASSGGLPVAPAAVPVEQAELDVMTAAPCVWFESLESRAPALRAVAEQLGLDPSRPALVAPLCAGDELAGVLLVTGADAAPGELDRDFLACVANAAAVTLHSLDARQDLLHAYDQIRADAARLEDANARLARLDQLKGDFLAFICHELRTPLTMVSAVESLPLCRTDGDREQMLAAVRGGYDRLRRLIERGLEYQTWLVRRPLVPQLLSARHLVEEVVGAFVAGRTDGAAVNIRVPGDDGPVSGDRSALVWVLQALLDNAVKFGGAGGTIDVEVADGGPAGGVRIAITDYGTGFPPEWADEIKRPFTIRNSMNHSRGTALNLAQADAILAAHGGTLEASSAGPGQGATFTLVLPRAVEVEASLPLAA